MGIVNYITCVCDEVIVKSIDGAFKVRSKILVFKNNQAFAVCKSCSREIRIPVKFDPSAMLPPLILKNK